MFQPIKPTSIVSIACQASCLGYKVKVLFTFVYSNHTNVGQATNPISCFIEIFGSLLVCPLASECGLRVKPSNKLFHKIPPTMLNGLWLLWASQVLKY